MSQPRSPATVTNRSRVCASVCGGKGRHQPPTECRVCRRPEHLLSVAADNRQPQPKGNQPWTAMRTRRSTSSPSRRPPRCCAFRSRPVTLACHWCYAPIEVKPLGRLPRWCSAQCRHLAWEQARAAASGRTAELFVEQVVRVEREVEVETLPRGPGWAPALHTLAHQVDTGRVYDRDLPALTDAYLAFGDALRRRSHPAAPHR